MKKFYCIILCLCLFIVVGCNNTANKSEKTCELYFLRNDESGMVIETRNIPGKTLDILEFTINELLNGQGFRGFRWFQNGSVCGFLPWQALDCS